MKKIMVMMFMGANTAFSFGSTDLLYPALETRTNITNRLEECGTNEYAANDSRIARPQVPAHRAYITTNGNWLAGYHFRSTYGDIQDFRWIRGNGTAVAWMTLLADNELTFGTTTGGTQARMNRFFTTNGEAFNYWCGSQRVSKSVFRECVEARWVQYLLNSFCSH